MKPLKTILLIAGAVLSLGFAFVPTTANAFDPISKACTDAATKDTALCAANKTDNPLPKIITNIVNILLYLLAAVSVVFIIMAGIFYTTSGGNAANVKRAKDTLMYSVVGLVVAILAYTIVNFVITYIK